MYFKGVFFTLVIIFSFLILNTINDYRMENQVSIKTNNINKNVKTSKRTLNWDVPKNWQEIPGNDFSLAVYKIKNTTPNSEVSITQFPGKAGGIVNNINRWRRQIGLLEMSENEILDDAIVRYSNLGKYTLHKIINNEKPELAFLGMVLFLEDSSVFVKLKTSLRNIPLIEPAFLKFCDSLRI